MFSGAAPQCGRKLAMRQPDGLDPEALLRGYTAGELSPSEERALFEAAAADQDLFDQLTEAEGLRHALSFPEERQRASAVLQAWKQQGGGGSGMETSQARQPGPSILSVMHPRIPGTAPRALLR